MINPNLSGHGEVRSHDRYYVKLQAYINIFTNI